jgi:lactobin A/cerein 7B family class IIb bacteriocin|tara:strand:+ start:318 stop:506 length:189 start_codon:yes stop_codon:yes gene_type:complete
MKELTMNQMEEVYGGVIPPLMVAAVKLVAATAVVAAVTAFVTNVVDDLMDDSDNSCPNPNAS